MKKSDKDLYKRKYIITAATDFYRNLYNDKTQTPSNLSINMNTAETAPANSMGQDGEETIKTISKTEIIEAIKGLKTEKSPGSDYITNEAIKTAHYILATPLAELFNLILRTSKTPTQWPESNII